MKQNNEMVFKPCRHNSCRSARSKFDISFLVRWVGAENFRLVDGTLYVICEHNRLGDAQRYIRSVIAMFAMEQRWDDGTNLDELANEVRIWITSDIYRENRAK